MDRIMCLATFFGDSVMWLITNVALPIYSVVEVSDFSTISQIGYHNNTTFVEYRLYPSLCSVGRGRIDDNDER
jgi:hypothetical protein